MKTLIKHCFTGIDGESWDLGRVLWGLGVLAFIVYAGAAMWFKGQPFDPQAYGIGFGAVLAAGGAAIGMKAKTEPQ